MFQTILNTPDRDETWNLLSQYIADHRRQFIRYACSMYSDITDAFLSDDVKTLTKAYRSLDKEKQILKSERRKETLCLRRVAPETAIERSAWFHLSLNSCMGITYNLQRICEVSREHVANNFRPLPQNYSKVFEPLRLEILGLLSSADEVVGTPDERATSLLREECDRIKDRISLLCREVYADLRNGSAEVMTVSYVYLNLLQESQEMVSALRKQLRASLKLHRCQEVNFVPATERTETTPREAEGFAL